MFLVIAYVLWVALIALVNHIPRDRPRVFIHGVEYFKSDVEYWETVEMFPDTEDLKVTRIYAS